MAQKPYVAQDGKGWYADACGVMESFDTETEAYRWALDRLWAVTDQRYKEASERHKHLAALLPDAAGLAAMAKAIERVAPGLGQSDFNSWGDYATTIDRLRATARLLRGLGEAGHG